MCSSPADGTGPTVVLVHRNVSLSLFFQPLMLALPPKVRALAIDLRDFGERETLQVDTTRGGPNRRRWNEQIDAARSRMSPCRPT